MNLKPVVAVSNRLGAPTSAFWLDWSHFHHFFLFIYAWLFSHTLCTHLLFLLFLSCLLLVWFSPHRVPEINSDLCWKKTHMWGPFWNTKHFCNCNIWVYVAPMFFFFTIMDLPCSCFPSWRSPCCCHPGDVCNENAVSSWRCSLDLGWKILNNKKGKFNPCSVDLWELLSFV